MALTRDLLTPDYPGTDGTGAATILRLRVDGRIPRVLVKCKDASPAAMIAAVQQGSVLAALVAGVDSFATGYGVPLAQSDSYEFRRPTAESRAWFLLFQGNTATFHVEAIR